MQGRYSKEPQITTGDFDELDNLEEEVSTFAYLLVMAGMIFAWAFSIVVCLVVVVAYLVASGWTLTLDALFFRQR